MFAVVNVIELPGNSGAFDLIQKFKDKRLLLDLSREVNVIII